MYTNRFANASLQNVCGEKNCRVITQTGWSYLLGDGIKNYSSFYIGWAIDTWHNSTMQVIPHFSHTESTFHMFFFAWTVMQEHFCMVLCFVQMCERLMHNENSKMWSHWDLFYFKMFTELSAIEHVGQRHITMLNVCYAS